MTKFNGKVKAFIFDMDGTTVNSINSIAYFANRALAMRNLAPFEPDRYKKFVGEGAKVLVRRMIDADGGTEQDYDFVLNEYNSTYDNNFLYLAESYEGITDMLAKIKAAGCKAAILSNKPDTTAVKISEELFPALIDVCHGGRDGIPLKPDPTGVLALLDELGVSAEETVYVGDTKTDMITGKSAGLFTVGVLWGFRDRAELEENGADVIISHPSELLEICKIG